VQVMCAIKTDFEATHTPKPVRYCYIQLSNRLSAYCLALCVLRIFCSHHRGIIIPTSLSAVILNRLLHYFVVHTTCTLSVHWTIPHCLSSLSTILWCFIMQSAYITIWNTSLRAQISFFQLYQLLFLSSVSTSADAGY